MPRKTLPPPPLPPESLTVTTAAITTIGERSAQEDAVTVFGQGHLTVLAVADGLGGHDNGDKASHEAVEALYDLWKSWPRLAEQDVGTAGFWHHLYKHINARVRRVHGHTTLTVVAINPIDRMAHFAWSGDSTGMILTPMGSRSRTYKRALVTGRHGGGNTVDRCLGGTDNDAMPAYASGSLSAGDRVIVMSDGFDEAFGLDETGTDGTVALDMLYAKRSTPMAFSLTALEALTRALGSTDNATAALAALT